MSTLKPTARLANSVGHPLTFRDAGVRALWWREYAPQHTRVSVHTQDGVEIRGIHLHADHRTLLVYCHGFMGGKNYAYVRQWAQMLAGDMDVIVFDFRGHGESGGATTLGEKEVLDLDAVCQYAASFGYSRTVVMGSSMGGAVSIRYAADAPNVDAVITMGAFAHKRFSIMAMAGLGLLKWSVSRRVMHHTYTTRIERAVPPYDPRDFVGAISPRPLLLIHGAYDPLIPLAHARELFARAREPKTLRIIRHGGHDMENLNAATKQVILTWLGSGAFPGAGVL